MDRNLVRALPSGPSTSLSQKCHRDKSLISKYAEINVEIGKIIIEAQVDGVGIII